MVLLQQRKQLLGRQYANRKPMAAWQFSSMRTAVPGLKRKRGINTEKRRIDEEIQTGMQRKEQK